MIAWMQQKTLYLNVVPATGVARGAGMMQNPQECFNKALKTVAVLHPPSEATATKRYTAAKFQQLRAACLLTVP
jgi:hypothetical protein